MEMRWGENWSGTGWVKGGVETNQSKSFIRSEARSIRYDPLKGRGGTEEKEERKTGDQEQEPR